MSILFAASGINPVSMQGKEKFCEKLQTSCLLSFFAVLYAEDRLPISLFCLLRSHFLLSVSTQENQLYRISLSLYMRFSVVQTPYLFLLFLL